MSLNPDLKSMDEFIEIDIKVILMMTWLRSGSFMSSFNALSGWWPPESRSLLKAIKGRGIALIYLNYVGTI